MGFFGIAVFTPDKINFTRRENKLEFDSNGQKPEGVKALHNPYYLDIVLLG